MPEVTVQMYRIPTGYFGSGTATIQDQLTVTISDDDTILEANETSDPGTSQIFSSAGHTITSYSVVFDTSFEWFPPGATSPVTVTAKVLSMTVNGQLGYYLMSDSGAEIPSLAIGSVVDRLAHTTYTPVAYSDIACFVAGTLIDTPDGPRPVEDIRPGDLVLTEDGGPLPVRWAGATWLGPQDLGPRPEIVPIRVTEGALGPGLPERDLFLSPQHRVLLTGWRVELLFGEAEVLVPVKQLLSWPGVEIVEGCAEVSYHHIMFDAHEIVRANGMPAESFYLGDQIRDGMDREQVEEVLALFPELAASAPAPARHFSKSFEVAAMAPV